LEARSEEAKGVEITDDQVIALRGELANQCLIVGRADVLGQVASFVEFLAVAEALNDADRVL
jgi:hypothetical protein